MVLYSTMSVAEQTDESKAKLERLSQVLSNHFQMSVEQQMNVIEAAEKQMKRELSKVTNWEEAQVHYKQNSANLQRLLQ